MSDHEATQEEVREDAPPSDPDDERWQMGDASEAGREDDQQDSGFYERGEQGG